MGFVALENGMQIPAGQESYHSNVPPDLPEPLPCPGDSANFNPSIADAGSAYMDHSTAAGGVQVADGPESLSSNMAAPGFETPPSSTSFNMEHTARVAHGFALATCPDGPGTTVHAGHHPLPSGLCLDANELPIQQVQHFGPEMLPSASQDFPAFLIQGREANINSMAAPCMEAPQPSMPFEVHSYLADNAIACAPVAPTNEISLQESNVLQVAASSLAKVATTLPANTPKTISIIKPFDEADLQVRPAIVRIDGGQVLSATVQQDPRVVEWEWSRAAAAIGLKTDKHSQFLKRNREQHYSELLHAEISQDQLLYRGVGSGARGQHGMGSSAFMLLILLVCLTKQHTPSIKAAALRLAVDLLKVAVASMSTAVSCVGIVYGNDKKYHEQALEIDSTGLVKNLNILLRKHPGCMWAWSHLMLHGFCNYKITSASTHPTLWDLIILLAWSKNSPTVKKVWVNFGEFLWPKILFAVGLVLDNLAFLRSQQPIEQLPLLRTKKGRARHVHWVNKLVLLRKMRLVKKSRKQAATSHGDIIPATAQLVLAEEFLACSLYAQKIKQAYQDCFHFCVHWDPSSYDVETFVGILFSTQCGPDGMAAYLPIQNLRPVLKSEVDPEIQALSSINKLTRIQGYCEIRALSHALLAVNMPLQRFVFPQSLLWKPLMNYENRLFENGEFWITNSRTGEKIPQIPSGWSIATQPLLVSLSDQGGINRAGLDYLVFKLDLSIHVYFDPYHRGWNDIKDSLKKSKGDLFKCFLSFALLWNVNYGPFGSKEWHQKKNL